MSYLVKVGFGEEREERIAWLKANGYKGSVPKNEPYGVIIIRYNDFFCGNVTCFAASVSSGNKVISWEEWKSRINK